MTDLSKSSDAPQQGRQEVRQEVQSAGARGAPSQRQDGDSRQREAAVMLPAVEVVERPDGITLLADLPGVPREALQLRVEGETLTIEGEIWLALPEGMQPSHAEVQRMRYRRAFTLSRELDSDKIEAELRQGVLRLRIPKAEHAQPRRIEVRVQ
jgi:HSP20 family protein